MEEDLAILEEFIEIDRRVRNNKVESDYDEFCEERCAALEHLISAYKKLEEENKEYRKINSIVDKISSKDIEKVMKEFNNNYIPKQAIIDIIEELEKRVMETKKTNYYARLTIGDAIKIKSFLQHEILENSY